MSNVIALIPTDTRHTRLGLPSMLDRQLATRSILQHTLARIARVEQISTIVLLHPANQDPMALVDVGELAKPIATFADPEGLVDPFHAWRTASRKWALSAWRGGLGGSTCYDELLPATPMVEAMKQHDAQSALLVGADWPLVDPALCERVLEMHLSNPEAMKMPFTQAPPGLAGLAIGLDLISQIAEKHSTFGRPLAYDPTHPQADAIGLDVCVQIDATVRSCVRRFVYDTPRSAAIIDAVVQRLGNRFDHADALAITKAAHALSDELDELKGLLPQEVTLEVNARRLVDGPIVPQHHVTLNRDSMPIEQAIQVAQQMGEESCGRDIALTIGGLGDALLYEPIEQLIIAAHEAKVFGIALETDLLVERDAIDRVLSLPVDIVTVRLNADRAATYQSMMNSDRFAQVIQNMEYFLSQRNHRATHGQPRIGLPWLVPRLIKTEQTLGDMETFFDRWVHFAGHAVIEPATTGRGPKNANLMPPASPINMAPPRRIPCRQLLGRMTIHCDGVVPYCDQDWLGGDAAGNASQRTLVDLWSDLKSTRACHRAADWDQLPICQGCSEWHRP